MHALFLRREGHVAADIPAGLVSQRRIAVNHDHNPQIMPVYLGSGLVYTERTFSPLPTRCVCNTPPTWRRGLYPKYEVPPWRGVRRLSKIAIRGTVRNLHLLDAATLNAVPAPVLERVWEVISRSDRANVKVWQLFAQTLLGTRAFAHTWRTGGHGDACPVHRLPYLVDVASMSDCWVTNLKVTGGGVQVQEWAYVIKLRNLRNVHVIRTEGSGRSTFSDRIVKAWALAAKEEGAFPNLQMIFVNGVENITVGSLYHLTSFAKLNTFCVQDCSIASVQSTFDTAMVLGWVSEANGSFDYHAEALDDKEYEPLRWDVLVDSYISHRRDLIPTDVDDLAVLNVELTGAPVNRNKSYWRREETLCFEREPTAPATIDHVVDGEVLSPSEFSARKKRKIKGGRSIALDEMLDGL